jgi:hypothetical protein
LLQTIDLKKIDVTAKMAKCNGAAIKSRHLRIG